MRYEGKLRIWKDDRGFGFIEPTVGGDDIYVHAKSFLNRGRRPAVNETLTYELRTGSDGRFQADKVAYEGESTSGDSSTMSSALLSGSFLVFVGAVVFRGDMPLAVLGIYVVMSLLAIVAYAMDKSAARKGARRTEELTLHLIALFGGWPGALVAQQMFRHKTKKIAFRVIFWLTVTVNCAVLAWFLSPPGSGGI